MNEGFPSPNVRVKNNCLAPRPPSLGTPDERAKSSPGMSRMRLSDQTGLYLFRVTDSPHCLKMSSLFEGVTAESRSPGMSPRMLRSAGSSRPHFTGRPVTAAGAFGGSGHRGSVDPQKDDIVAQAIQFAQSKVSSYGMGESSLLSTKLQGTPSKTQEKLEYQQRLVAHLKQQVATLHIHGQRLLYQNKELKRKLDLLQTKLEEESQTRRANEAPQEESEEIDETLPSARSREDRAVQVPSGNFENIASAKTRLAAFLSSAIWTWKFTDASGALVSSDDQSVGSVGTLFRLSPADQPASLAKATAESGACPHHAAIHTRQSTASCCTQKSMLAVERASTWSEAAVLPDGQAR
eukprot:3236329-Rhodomonas_salina.1